MMNVLAVWDSWEILIPIGLIVLLFGGSQIPKLARSIGSASSEFKRGIEEGSKSAQEDSAAEGKDAGEAKSASKSETTADKAD